MKRDVSQHSVSCKWRINGRIRSDVTVTGHQKPYGPRVENATPEGTVTFIAQTAQLSSQAKACRKHNAHPSASSQGDNENSIEATNTERFLGAQQVRGTVLLLSPLLFTVTLRGRTWQALDKYLL